MKERKSSKKPEIKMSLNKVTVEEALRRASFCLEQAEIVQPRTEAELMLAYYLKVDRLRLIMNNDHLLPQNILARFQEAVKRRARAEPFAYITGEKYFFGRCFSVNKNVLIPRPETELIVEGAIEWVVRRFGLVGQKVCCVDLGTGSGILAVTLALEIPGADVWAVELYDAPLQTAKKNAAKFGVEERIHWVRGSYFQALERIGVQPGFNLIVSNPPYVSGADMEKLPEGVKYYEPSQALYGGDDGLDGVRTILEELPRFMKKPAIVLVEVGAGQREKIEDLFRKTRLFDSISWRCDLAGWPRVIEGHVYNKGLKSS